MLPTARSTPASPAYRLLALCARAECDTAQYTAIAQAAADLTAWDAIPAQAEAHGLAPLVYRHTVAANISLALPVKRELQGLSVRHRLANQVRTRILQDILTRCRSASIRVIVLKGAALSHLIYPEPGLRPMRDLDLLVAKSDLFPAQRLLGEMGFCAPLVPAGQNPEHRHLSAATKSVEGFIVGVEVHQNLFEPGASSILMGINELTSAPLTFALEPNGITVDTLGYEDTMWYLCQHLIESTNVFSSVGLIWVADAVRFAERFADKIDWQRVHRQYPLVRSTLSLLHFLTPLSDSLLARAGIELGRAPRGMWDDFRKSPRTSPEAQIDQGYARTLRDALFPSEWWMRLYYGVGSAPRLTARHRAQHLAYLVRRFVHVMRRRSRNRGSSISVQTLET